MKKIILLTFILSISSIFAEDVKFRSGIFLHHSTGGNIWGPNGSNTSVPDEIDDFNLDNSYTGDDACSLNEAGWPTNFWDNEWNRWHNIFDGNDPDADISNYLANNKIIVIKSCFPSSAMSGIGSADDMSESYIKSLWNYKWHWRSIIRKMQEHPNNFFVIWTNAPLVPNATNANQALLSHQFCSWAKDILGAGLDDEFGPLPKNVYVFDFFHKLVDENYMLDIDYAADEWDSHPNANATELVAPQFVEEIFDAAIAYEEYYNSMRNRVNLQLQNVKVEENVFSVELWAFPDKEIGWDVGSSNIVVNYNSNALNCDDYAGEDASEIGSELDTEGYTVTQTNAGTGKVSMNIMKSGSPFVNKTEPFKIAELRWDIINSIAYHDLSINESNTEVFNANDLQLIYNCDSDICYGIYDNNNGIVGGSETYDNRVFFAIKNRMTDDDIFYAELWAYAPDDGGQWDIGACNIILNYNTDALSATNYNGVEIEDADQTLIDDGYYFTQTALSGGRVSFNIMKSSNPFTSLLGWIKLGTIKLDVTSSNQNDGFSFNTNTTEVYDGFSNMLTYGCKDNSCYGIINPNEYFIDGPADQLPPPSIIFPANNADYIVVNPTLDWDNVNNADGYDLQVSTMPNFIQNTIEETNITNTNFPLNDLSSVTKYYWRVRAYNENQTSQWTTAVFTTLWNVPIIWDPPSTAGPTATVTAEAVIEPIIGERDFINGDAIGVFFTDDADDLVCAGFGVWNGEDLDIIIYGDDPATDEKDGFDASEPFFFKVWDAMVGEQYDAEFTIREGDPTSFQEDGLSYLETLHGITEITHIFNLVDGWNMISTYAIPDDPSIALLLESIEDDMLIVRNVAGQIYFPSLGINNIVNWNLLEGYKIYMMNPAYLEITGLKAKPEEHPFDLNTGWSILSYLRETEMDIETAVESIEGQFLIIKDINGRIYLPSLGLSSLSSMSPGIGYMIYMMEEGTLTYPSNSSPRKAITNSAPVAEMLIPKSIRTGNYASVILNVDEKYDELEIGAFSISGELIGSGKIMSGLCAITVWGDNDQTTQTDGALENETIIFKILDESGFLSDLSISNAYDLISGLLFDQVTYSKDDVMLADADIKERNSIGSKIIISPNPTNGIVSLDISLDKISDIDIEIFTNDGIRLSNYQHLSIESGSYQTKIDLSEMPSSVYILRIQINKSICFRKVILLK